MLYIRCCVCVVHVCVCVLGVFMLYIMCCVCVVHVHVCVLCVPVTTLVEHSVQSPTDPL